MPIDFNYIFLGLIYFSAFLTFVSGAAFVVSSFFKLRSEVNQSMNLDLEIIRVSKPEEPKDNPERKTHEMWKEEIGAMEQLLMAIAGNKSKIGFFKKVF